jgi:hypothetical protein
MMNKNGIYSFIIHHSSFRIEPVIVVRSIAKGVSAMSSGDLPSPIPLEGEPLRAMPPLPELGEVEKVYGKRAQHAEKSGDVHGASANKVAQYVTLALDSSLDWPGKARYFEHALKKHAAPKPPIDDQVIAYYLQLQSFVKQYAGSEALKLVYEQNAELQARKDKKEVIFKLRSEAAQFFKQFLPQGDKPDWFNDEDYRELISIRNKWA